MNTKTLGSVVVHEAFALAVTAAFLRALPDEYFPLGALLVLGFACICAFLVLGVKWEFEWQAQVRRRLKLSWWDRDGSMEAAVAFPVGALLGTLLGVLWR